MVEGGKDGRVDCKRSLQALSAASFPDLHINYGDVLCEETVKEVTSSRIEFDSKIKRVRYVLSLKNVHGEIIKSRNRNMIYLNILKKGEELPSEFVQRVKDTVEELANTRVRAFCQEKRKRDDDEKM